MDAVLYQFPFSHYCEKARWALDFKQVGYKIRDLLPGLHRLTLRAKVKDTTLPVLCMNGLYTQGSNHIINFLDQIIATKKLTPTESDQHVETIHWENFAATELGTPLTVFHYSHLLNTPNIFRKQYIQSGPWYSPVYYALTFKRICRVIRILYHISHDSAEQSRTRIEAGLHKLERHLHARHYLVGDQFSRADLAVAALLSPLVIPQQRGEKHSSTYPALTEFRAQLASSPVTQWVKQIYQMHRH